MAKNLEVPSKALRKECDPATLRFKTTNDLVPMPGTIGQDRAEKALDFGLNFKVDGFNLYAAGPVGVGRAKTIMRHIEKVAAQEEAPCDWCYVYNFEDPRRPNAIKMPPGRGNHFSKDMEELISDARRDLPKVFESEEYEKRRGAIVAELEKKRESLIAEAQERAEKLGFSVRMTLGGLVTVPLIDGKPMETEQFEALPEQQRRTIRSKGEAIQTEIHQIMHKVRELEKEARERIGDLDKEVSLLAVGHLLDGLKEKYADCEQVLAYLDAVEADIINNLDDFKTQEQQEVPPLLRGLQQAQAASLSRYSVNVFVDNSDLKGAPVVVERNPNYYNLFGRIEYESVFGGMTTDFRNIKAGAIHRANGGYLIIEALEALISPLVWETLKRTLKSREVKIENIGQQLMLFPAVTLEAAPIPLDVKVIMIGNRLIHSLLFEYDEDFQKLFKVKADFHLEMDRNAKHVRQYAAFVADVVEERALKHFDAGGVAKVIEYGSWLAEDQTKLATRFLAVDDLVSEASFWASRNGNKLVTAKDVQRAEQERRLRSNMVEEKIQEMIERGVLLIDTKGATVGQVNGLAVTDVGDYSFGYPTRLTARTSLGRAGVVSIDREVKMSGPIHNKGVLTLAGYLAGAYGRDKPLSLAATITFEQAYSGVEGDSASSTELYALLSSLADVRINQQIAVTGSVNQLGQVQPIGAVNRKIEGFFDVCGAKGLTGEQGVIVPKANRANLMLREDIVEAVADGRFHIWAVATVDEGIEILTGVPAGKRRKDGTYPPGTVNRLVDDKLREMAKALKEFGDGEKEKKAAGDQ